MFIMYSAIVSLIAKHLKTFLEMPAFELVYLNARIHVLNAASNAISVLHLFHIFSIHAIIGGILLLKVDGNRMIRNRCN